MIAPLSPINLKRMDISRSSINWWAYTNSGQIVSLKAKPTPSSPCLISSLLGQSRKLGILLQKRLFSQLSLFPAGQRSHSQVVGPSPARTRRGHTRSSLSQPACIHCRSLPPQVPLARASRDAKLSTDAWSDLSVFFSFFVFSLSRCREALCFLARCLPSFPMVGFSRPSPSQPRHSRPRCRGVCLPMRCPVSPTPRCTHSLRSPLWRCSSSAFGTNPSASGLKTKIIIPTTPRRQ